MRARPPPHPDPLPARGEREKQAPCHKPLPDSLSPLAGEGGEGERRHGAGERDFLGRQLARRRQGGDGELRNVRVLRHQAGDAARPEPRAEAVDEVPQLGIVGENIAGERGLHRGVALGDESGEPHHVVAEAGIAGVADGGEPVGEQADDAGRLAQRRAGPDLDPVDLVVGAKQDRLQEPRALLAAFHRGAELGCEPCDGAEHVALEADRIGEALLRHIGRQRQARRDRLVLAAERLVDAADEDLPNRAASGARGRSRRSPTALSPTSASAATVSGASRSAAVGSGISAARIRCGGTSPASP